MLPRHAAALALVGWYLIVPPRGNNGSQAILSGWTIVHSYDTARECEQAHKDRLAAMPKLPPLPSGFVPKFPDSFVCVASDDPRLRLPLEFHMP
jgi:hypothetical protein